MASDKEILDEIEKIVDTFTASFYATDNDETKRSIASFSLGLIGGTLMRRGK